MIFYHIRTSNCRRCGGASVRQHSCRQHCESGLRRTGCVLRHKARQRGHLQYITDTRSGDGYDGNYLTVDALQAGEQTFSLAGITQPGSYRLYVTVSKDGQRLLTVPYYFIVQ